MVDQALFSSNNQCFGTPKFLYKYLDDTFHFEYDLAASHKNHLAPKYYTEEDNALIQPWEPGNHFLNPPYIINNDFSVKIDQEMLKYSYLPDRPLSVHLLVPSRTDTPWFHRLVPWLNDITFIEGRLRFLDDDGNPAPTGAPFPSMIMHLHSDVADDPDREVLFKTMHIEYPNKIGRKRDYSHGVITVEWW